MTDRKFTLTLFLVLACCFVLILLPMHAAAQVGGVINGAQKGIEKGVDATKQGAETGVQKGKEGAEAVGQGTKELFTGKDEDQSNTRLKSTESQSEATSTENQQTARKNLPKTAGELPLLALTGCLALAGAAAIQFRKQVRE